MNWAGIIFLVFIAGCVVYAILILPASRVCPMDTDLWEDGEPKPHPDPRKLNGM